jgi:hypothetical protein
MVTGNIAQQTKSKTIRCATLLRRNLARIFEGSDMILIVRCEANEVAVVGADHIVLAILGS